MLSLALFALVTVSLPAQDPHFADIRKASWPLVDTVTLEVFVADLDRDGRLDLVPGSVSNGNYAPARPLAYWNRGQGRLEAGMTTAAPDGSPLGVGDLDRDGDIDVVAVEGVYRSDGQERFTLVPTAWRSVAIGSHDRFAVGDVNGDGLVDVCTGHQPLALWLNQGGLAFTDATAQVPSQMVGNPSLADVDLDGDLDLLTFAPQTSNAALLALNDGTGRFTVVATARFPAPARDMRDVVIVDLDGDLRPEILLVGPHGPALLWNLGAAAFADQTGRLNSWLPAHAVAAGDVDGDGSVDLVYGGFVHLNRGGTFAVAVNAWRPTPGPIQDLVLVDLDQDGDLDLVEARSDHPDGYSIYGMANHVAWNDGSGRFRGGVIAPIPLTIPAGGAALGDLDGDGAPDLLLGGGGVSLLRGDGRGTFRAPQSRQLPVSGRSVLGDLDGDGDLDGVLVGASAFTILINPGDGLLQPTVSVFYGTSSPGASGTAGVLGDFDGDGALDLLVATVGPGQPPYFFGPAPELLYRGDGRGGFALMPTLLPGGSLSFDVVAGDLDGDGDLDAVVDGLVVYRNTPNGFATASYWHSEAGRSRLRLADLDGDGDLDLASGNGCDRIGQVPSCNYFTDSPRESVSWNDGRGGFGSFLVLPTALSNTRATAVGDIDEDGDIDLVFGNIDYPNTPSDELVLNDGGRTFRNAWSGPTWDQFPYDTGNTHDLFLADLDFDGDLDIVAVDDPPGDSGYPASRVYVNLTRQLRTPDLARLGLPYRLWLEGAAQGGVLFLAAGPGRALTPFGRFGLDLATTVVVAGFGPPVRGRRVSVEPTVPADPSLLDGTLWWQGAVFDGAAVRLTNVVADPIGW